MDRETIMRALAALAAEQLEEWEDWQWTKAGGASALLLNSPAHGALSGIGKRLLDLGLKAVPYGSGFIYRREGSPCSAPA